MDFNQNRKLVKTLNEQRERALRRDERVMTFLYVATAFAVGFTLCLILLVKGGCHV